jgi:hypothetical protein
MGQICRNEILQTINNTTENIKLTLCKTVKLAKLHMRDQSEWNLWTCLKCLEKHEKSMDFCGPLPTGEYPLVDVIVDEYSRYPVVEITKSVSLRCKCYGTGCWWSVINLWVPTGYQNWQWQSNSFAHFASYSGFIHRRIAPRWPRASVQAESFNKPLMKAVRAATVEGKCWKQQLHKFLRQYRATPHPSTGFSPYHLMFGRTSQTRLETFRLTFTANVKPLARFLILQLYYNSSYTSFEMC